MLSAWDCSYPPSILGAAYAGARSDAICQQRRNICRSTNFWSARAVKVHISIYGCQNHSRSRRYRRYIHCLPRVPDRHRARNSSFQKYGAHKKTGVVEIKGCKLWLVFSKKTNILTANQILKNIFTIKSIVQQYFLNYKISSIYLNDINSIKYPGIV